MNSPFKCDLHIHSKYSFDSFLSPKWIVKRSVACGFHAIAITDHNTIKGSKIAQSTEHGSLIIITGAEIATEYGDLTGLFLNDEVKSRFFGEVVDEIKGQGGLVVLPHPCRRKKNPPLNLLREVDLMEGINGRTSDQKNRTAQDLAHKLKKPMIAGSDAHTVLEIGTVWTSIQSEGKLEDDDLRKAIISGNNLLFQKSNWPIQGFSQAYSTCIRQIRKRNPPS